MADWFFPPEWSAILSSSFFNRPAPSTSVPPAAAAGSAEQLARMLDLSHECWQATANPLVEIAMRPLLPTDRAGLARCLWGNEYDQRWRIWVRCSALPAEELEGVRVSISLCRLRLVSDSENSPADGDGHRAVSGERSHLICDELLDGDYGRVLRTIVMNGVATFSSLSLGVESGKPGACLQAIAAVRSSTCSLLLRNALSKAVRLLFPLTVQPVPTLLTSLRLCY